MSLSSCRIYENEYDENIQIQTHKYDRRIEIIIEDIQDNTSEEMRCCEEEEWRGSVEKGRDGDGRVRVGVFKVNWIWNKNINFD